MNSFEELQREIGNFAFKRNWDVFHTPKNLALAIAGECGELSAEFQWLTDEEASLNNLTHQKLNNISLEMADVAIYLLRLASVLEIDLESSIRAKLKINELRFPESGK